MDLPIIFTFCLSFLLLCQVVRGTTFTFINRCDHTVWPGILANAGSPSLDSTGFELQSDGSRSFVAPTGWAGRFWARTGCNFDGSGEGSCGTGDCGSGQVECNGAGAAPPATLAEFSIATGGQDFYDVSLVDGYNLPLLVEGSGGTGMCAPTGCVADLNRICPSELKVDGGAACKSACDAFAQPEYCCSGEFNSPAACKPSVYSQMFKNLCPRSYSYAYDDPTSTFTCSGADYTLTFCPSMPSSKASKDPMPSTGSNNADGSMPETGAGNDMGSGTGALVTSSGSDSGTGSGMGMGTRSGSEAMLADGSYLAGLAMGDAIRVPVWNPVTLFFVACVFTFFRL